MNPLHAAALIQEPNPEDAALLGHLSHETQARFPRAQLCSTSPGGGIVFVSLLSFYHPWGYSVRLIIYLFIYFQAVSAALNVHGRVQCSRT